MKVSDLMLDLATGDASVHDVYIQEAVGKINVSTAIFDAAHKISELPAGEFLIVQEAADAGLPTDQEGAANLCCESVKQSLTAFYDLIVETAKKLKSNSDKDLKLLVTIGKKYGVAAPSGNYVEGFVEPLVNAIMADAGKKLTLADKRFLKAKYSEEIAECYGMGMTNFLSAFGMEFDNAALTNNYRPYKTRREVTSFKALLKNMSYGGKIMNFDKTISKEKHYTDTINASDLTELITALVEVHQISTAIVNVAGNSAAKKNSMAIVTELCDKEDCESKKVSKNITAINDGIKGWTEIVAAMSENVPKAFNDSITSLMDSISGSQS